MNSLHDAEGWNFVSQVYSEVERLTVPLAQALVDRVHSQNDLSDSKATVFDNGCGTGVLTAVLKARFPSLPILATDASSDMVDILKRKNERSGWKDVAIRTLDARKLDGIPDDEFSHTFSTFMVCLAPEPGSIIQEMYRVTKPGGSLGLGNWGDPYFSFFNAPWTKACRMLIPDYESAAIMGRGWTQVEDVKAGLEKVGFRNVDAREENGVWRWDSVGDLSTYFFEGGNPGNKMMIDSFKERGGKIDEARPLFEKIIGQDYSRDGNSVEGNVLACLAVAQK